MLWYRTSPRDAMLLPYTRRRRLVLRRKDIELKNQRKSGNVTQSI